MVRFPEFLTLGCDSFAGVHHMADGHQAVEVGTVQVSSTKDTISQGAY
jgi:hypothetical protein